MKGANWNVLLILTVEGRDLGRTQVFNQPSPSLSFLFGGKKESLLVKRF